MQICDKESKWDDGNLVITKAKEARTDANQLKKTINEFSQFGKDVEKMIKYHKQISKSFVKHIPRKVQQKNEAVLLLAALIKVSKTENPRVKSEEMTKIQKILKSYA